MNRRETIEAHVKNLVAMCKVQGWTPEFRKNMESAYVLDIPKEMIHDVLHRLEAEVALIEGKIDRTDDKVYPEEDKYDR